MAEKRITFTLDLTTDQAKRAIDEFTQQLSKAAQQASAPAAEWNKIGAAISDSFKKALQDVKQLQQQIQDEMKKGVSGIMQPGSPNSMSGKLVDGLKDMIKSEHETIKTAIKTTEQELSKNRDEYSKLVKDLDSKKLDPQMARDMAEKQNQISRLESDLRAKEQAAAVMQTALQKGAPTAAEVLQQLTQPGGGGTPPPTPPGPRPGPGGGDAFSFAGKAGALAQLIAGGGDLTSLISGGGMLSILTALGGMGGGLVGTTILTADKLFKGFQNRAASAAATERQFMTGGATEVTADLMARMFMQSNPTGAFGTAMAAGKDVTGFQGGLGFTDALDQLQFWARHGFNRDAAGNYIREKLFQEQGAFTDMMGRGFQGGFDRGNALRGVERMFGMDRTQRVAASFQGMGVPLERMAPGMMLMSEMMGRLPGGAPNVVSAGDMALLNFQNRFGLSDDAYRQVVRAQAQNPAAMNMIQGMMGAAGLGTPATDIATGRVMAAGAEYAARFDAAAAPGAMGVFMQGFQGVSAALPGLSPAEQSRYSNQVVNQRLAELNNPESLSNRTAMGTLGRLGITDPVEARVIMSMGLESDRAAETIAKITNRPVEEVKRELSSDQGRLRELQGARFGGNRLNAAMNDPNFTFNALRAGTARDLDAVRAQGGFEQSGLLKGGPGAGAIAAGRDRATGREETTVDLMQEQNAMIAGSLAKLTGVIEGGAMKVKIVEGGERIRQQDAETAAKQKADTIKDVDSTRTNKNTRFPTPSPSR